MHRIGAGIILAGLAFFAAGVVNLMLVMMGCGNIHLMPLFFGPAILCIAGTLAVTMIEVFRR